MSIHRKEDTQMNTVEKMLLKISEVVEVTGYSRAFLYERISAGELKVLRVGRTVRVATDDLREWIDSLKIHESGD